MASEFIYKEPKIPISIKEIDDVEFKQEVLNRVSDRDGRRSYEDHQTDLIFCLKIAYLHRLFPIQKYTKNAWTKILQWYRGIGFDIAFSSLFGGHYNIESDIHNPSASIDMTFKAIPYELKSMKWWGKYDDMFPFPTQFVQTWWYMARMRRTVGRLKCFNVLRDYEKTWQIRMQFSVLAEIRKVIEYRRALLFTALWTGDWEILPDAYFRFYCKHCDGCNDLEDVNKSKLRHLGRVWVKRYINHQKLHINEDESITRRWNEWLKSLSKKKKTMKS